MSDQRSRSRFIYAPFATLAFIWAYFGLVECKGLKWVFSPRAYAQPTLTPRLEQIDLLFEEHIPAPKSAAWGREHQALDITADAAGHMVSALDAEKPIVPEILKREDMQINDIEPKV